MSGAPFNSQAAVQRLKALVGLDDKNAQDLSTKPERVTDLTGFFETHQVTPDSPRELKFMLFNVWTKVRQLRHRDLLAGYVTAGKFTIMQKVDAAIRFVNGVKDAEGEIHLNELEQACGVGVEIGEGEVVAAVQKALAAEDRRALKATWMKNPNILLGKMRRVDGLRWAEVDHIRAALEHLIPELVRDVNLEIAREEASGEEVEGALTAAMSRKEVKTCPRSDNFRAVAKNLPSTRLGELAKAAEGSTVYLIGWAHRVRHQSRMSFVILRDGTGYVQCVFDGAVEPFHRESSLAIRGVIRSEPKAKTELQPPIEIHVQEYAIIGKSDGSIETIITAESSVDKLLDQRHIILRGTNGSTVMKVRHELLRIFREFFWSKGYYEVNPPTIVMAACEGGSTVFDLAYYGEKAYLTQSSQLYLETVTASLGNVYCCMPSYRAEKSKTKRHLSEYTHLEVEYDICTFEDLLSNLEELITHVFDAVIARAGNLIALLNPSQVIDLDEDLFDPSNYKYRPKRPFRRLRYSEAIEFCNANGILNPETGAPFKIGEDITDQPERAMVAKFNEFILMTHFPAEMKSFYMQRDPAEPALTESVDVLAPGIGEIVGGSMRMWNYEELMSVYERDKMDPSVCTWYIDQRRYGSVPHGGFGLGMERMLTWMLDLDSVKDACLYPRYMGRCKP
ncbi:unnamed protein product [Phytomonas sp. Hart1]|nr:unnamed protein product [Phytomonas sp. Hart1]|eukprot:CCW66550.1 unnamed protein product [Phytomonas sp. isolate Hart1]